jgi:Ribbon-helix-helix protein, copG family
MDVAKRMKNFRIDEELLAGLERIKARDGVSVSEQVRRSIVAWLRSKGEETPRLRARTRKRG